MQFYLSGFCSFLLSMRMCTNQLAENLKPWKMAMESPNTSISEDVCAIILRSIKEKQKVCCAAPERGRGGVYQSRKA